MKHYYTYYRSKYSDKFSSKLSNEFIDIDNNIIKWMLFQNNLEIENSQTIISNYVNKIYRNNSLIDTLILKNEIEPRLSGIPIQTPDGIAIKQEGTLSFYRGENQVFSSSLPSFWRNILIIESKTESEIKALKIINSLRLYEFYRLLNRFQIVQDWKFDIFYQQISQHYGLDTIYLDITQDFRVALFFACCYWNNNEKKYKPLTKELINQTENTKYGVIYHKPVECCEFNNLYAFNHGKKNCIFPVGYQPFYRCASQYAYTIKMETPFSLTDDITFEKLRFKQNEELSNYIYHLMNSGSKIFPLESLTELTQEIELINNMNTFSFESLNEVSKKYPEFKNPDEIINFIKNDYSTEIYFKNSSLIDNISQIKIDSINRQYQDEFNKNRDILLPKYYFNSNFIIPKE